jgi:undecaprenyl diphosphate synthase
MTKDLQHIAIIMDGNGRWAKKHELPTVMGHKKGAEVARKMLIACMQLKIPYLTLYTFSSENWQRSPEEVSDLIGLLKFYLANELPLLVKKNIRVKIIGNIAKFPQDVIDLVNKCEEETKNNDGIFLQIALSYGGREEIVDAQKKLLLDIKSARLKAEEINEDIFKEYLYTSSIPDPDLLIRTSGEYRISNFLLWQLAYTELYFTKTLWPDFTKAHLVKAIMNYKKRDRRYGSSK